ncbi:MAG: sigma-70 family RNA polymerase sigma factor [Acidobacteria bacterium]|nr:sigma-70 family RNA polymerase sigma factor [Acidobacteriota bacterium]
MVRNKCADRIRRAQRDRRRDVPFDGALTETATESGPDDADSGDRASLVAQLRKAVRALPPEQRTLLTLFYFDGLGVTAIAEAMDIPAGTVKSRLFHLRARLRKTMEE